jgi:hypothetical protein
LLPENIASTPMAWMVEVDGVPAVFARFSVAKTAREFYRSEQKQ